MGGLGPALGRGIPVHAVVSCPAGVGAWLGEGRKTTTTKKAKRRLGWQYGCEEGN